MVEGIQGIHRVTRGALKHFRHSLSVFRVFRFKAEQKRRAWSSEAPGTRRLGP